MLVTLVGQFPPQHGDGAVQPPPDRVAAVPRDPGPLVGAAAPALPSQARLAANLLLAMLGVQLALGISTLLLRVPVALGAAHQAGAMMLFALALWTTHTLYRDPTHSGVGTQTRERREKR